MSGFITTMFVSSPFPSSSSSSAYLPAFPAKPKPLVPVSTFVQSQSCMNLSMDLDVWSEVSGPRSGLDLARPRDAYQSPLQRAGAAAHTTGCAVPQLLIQARLKPSPTTNCSSRLWERNRHGQHHRTGSSGTGRSTTTQQRLLRATKLTLVFL